MGFYIMENIYVNQVERAKLLIYNMLRKIYLKKSICNIGKIVEKEDKIICYVNQKSLDKYNGKKIYYKLSLNGIKRNIDIINKLGLNKPIYYIFNDIKFNCGLKLTSLCCNVVFKNCTFDKNIWIPWCDNITFENNKYTDYFYGYYYGNCFFNANNANKITFINDNFINSYNLNQKSDANFGLDIDAKTVEFINTKVENDSSSSIKIEADKTIIKNSKINANELYIDSKSIDIDDSILNSKNGVIIENTNWDFKGDIYSPVIFYNGIKQEDKDKNDEKSNLTLDEARKKLVMKLGSLSDYCYQINDSRLNQYKEELNNESFVKTLKRR